MEIEERHKGQQREAKDALLNIEIVRRYSPDDPQCDPRHKHCQQIVRPLGERKYRKPKPYQPRGEGRMLEITKAKVARPGDNLGHIRMQALTTLGDGAIDGPQQHIDQERREDRALAARRIDDRVVPATGQSAGGIKGCRKLHARLVSHAYRYSSILRRIKPYSA